MVFYVLEFRFACESGQALFEKNSPAFMRVFIDCRLLAQKLKSEVA